MEEDDSPSVKGNTIPPESSPDLKVMQNDLLFSGMGAPAFMSPSEPAINLLKERYKESFAFVNGTEHRVHLFLIKVGLWSLVWTFVFKEIPQEDRYVMLRASLDQTYAALMGKEPTFLEDLDDAVKNAVERTGKMLERHHLKS